MKPLLIFLLFCFACLITHAQTVSDDFREANLAALSNSNVDAIAQGANPGWEERCDREFEAILLLPEKVRLVKKDVGGCCLSGHLTDMNGQNFAFKTFEVETPSHYYPRERTGFLDFLVDIRLDDPSSLAAYNAGADSLASLYNLPANFRVDVVAGEKSGLHIQVKYSAPLTIFPTPWPTTVDFVSAIGIGLSITSWSQFTPEKQVRALFPVDPLNADRKMNPAPRKSQVDR